MTWKQTPDYVIRPLQETYVPSLKPYNAFQKEIALSSMMNVD